MALAKTSRAATLLIVLFASTNVLATDIRPVDLDHEPCTMPLYVGGHDGYVCYRIPALVVTAKGTILAFCEARKNSGSDSGDIDLVVKRSHDLGQTWSRMQIVHEDGGDEQITIGNPCPIVDPETGIVHMTFTRNNARAFYTCSRDDGVTWTMPREITDYARNTDFEWNRIATGPGHGLFSREGWLLVPTWHNLRDEKHDRMAFRTALFISRDRGETWEISKTIPIVGATESMIVEADDGRWRMNVRARGRKMRMLAWTSDHGQTWEVVPAPELIAPVCQASTLHIPLPEGKRGLLFSNPASTSRDHLTVRLSEDDGKTWPYARCLHEGPSAYSDLVLLPDGTIGMMHEAGESFYSEEILFVRFNLKWLREKQAE